MDNRLNIGSEVRELKLGSTFTNAAQPSNQFHTIKYDFKPASVDVNKPAVLEVSANKQVTVTVPHLDGSGVPNTVFKGNQRDYSRKDCVLILNRATGEITLEQLNSSIVVKKTRIENKAPNPPPPLPTIKVENNTARQSSKTKITTGVRKNTISLMPKHSPLQGSPSYPHRSPQSAPAWNANNTQQTLPSIPMIGLDDGMDFGTVLPASSSFATTSNSSSSAATMNNHLNNNNGGSGSNSNPNHSSSSISSSNNNNHHHHQQQQQQQHHHHHQHNSHSSSSGGSTSNILNSNSMASVTNSANSTTNSSHGNSNSGSYLNHGSTQNNNHHGVGGSSGSGNHNHHHSSNHLGVPASYGGGGGGGAGRNHLHSEPSVEVSLPPDRDILPPPVAVTGIGVGAGSDPEMMTSSESDGSDDSDSSSSDQESDSSTEDNNDSPVKESIFDPRPDPTVAVTAAAVDLSKDLCLSSNSDSDD